MGGARARVPSPCVRPWPHPRRYPNFATCQISTQSVEPFRSYYRREINLNILHLARALGCPEKVKMVIDIPKHFAPVLNGEKINTGKFYSILTTFTGSTKSRLFEHGNTCKVYVVWRLGTICSKKV